MRLSRLGPPKGNPPPRRIAGARNLVGKGRTDPLTSTLLDMESILRLAFAQHMGRTIKPDLQLTKEPGLS
jgi:hypothetical protein